MKKIANIVFYKYLGVTGESKQACVFYNDGTVDSVSYQEGLEFCEEIAKERKIVSKEAFKELINKELIHVVSQKEFEKNFNSYITYDILPKEEINETIDTKLAEIPVVANEMNEIDEEDLFDEDEIFGKDYMDKVASEARASFIPLSFESKAKDLSGMDKVKPQEAYAAADKFDDIDNMETVEIPNIPLKQEDKPRTYKARVDKKEKGIGAFFRRKFNTAKKNRILSKIAAVGVAGALALGGFGIFNAFAKKVDEVDPDVAFASTGQSELTVNDVGVNSGDSNNGNEVLIRGNNEYYNDYTFEQLLEVTTNPTQKRTMNKLGFAIQNFNGTFADAYVEEGKDIRAALTFDEIVALQQAYNDYSKQEIKAIFNGAEIKSDELTRSYKDASLQLMGAYAIETREHPVDMSNLIESNEGKEFYKRYHEMFLACKEATGQEQLDRVNEFYAAVRSDFPITQEERTEGIAHADAYASIESYKLSVAPMIAAAEMMYQNLEVDYTLDDGEIDFLNDIGLCNYANDKFERIETITLSVCEDDMENPLYEQYRNAIIKMMEDKNQYVIDDAHRDLSKLDAFQKAVNWHFELVDGYYAGYTYFTTETYTETNSWSTSSTKTRTEVTRTEKEIPDEEKAKIDKEIAEENAKAKARAEKEAEKNRQKMQAEENKKAEEIKKEVEQDAKDMQNKIDNANNQIDNNNKDNDPSNDKPVNEKDFGDHNVDFDNNHSDSEGNLNDSVEDITTDGTGAHTPSDLPDPNKTGAEFDKQAPTEAAPAQEYEVVSEPEPVVESAPEPEPVVESAPEPEPVVESSPEPEPDYTISPDEPIAEQTISVEEVTTSESNEEIVDKYVEDMANADDEDKAKEKVK